MINKRIIALCLSTLLCISGVLFSGCSSSKDQAATNVQKAEQTEQTEQIVQEEPVEEPANTKLTFSEPQNYTSQGTGIIENESEIAALFDALDIVPVENSTCFSAVGYSDNDQIFYCKFLNSGDEYIYLDVPSEKYQELLNAHSKGGYYNQQIKPNYTCLKIRP